MFELIDMIIVRPIVNILFVIYNVVGDFGLAIIIFTVLVKILMWPLAKKQLHQTKLMRKIQPELTRIKKECNGNRQLESLRMMDLYKKNNIKPFRSILSLFIQLPIFIALYGSIRVTVLPTSTDNVQTRAYGFVQTMDKVQDVINKQHDYFETPDNGYTFRPKLFGVLDLSPKASLATMDSAIIMLFALASAYVQYWTTKQQMPKKKGKTFKQIMKEAAEGKEPDQNEINAAMSGQMSIMMPLMMLFIMLQLPGALVFYYLLSSLMTVAQQHFIFKKDEDEMEISADRAVIKELNKIKEAEVIENKKSGTKITRIKAKDNKKRRK